MSIYNKITMEGPNTSNIEKSFSRSSCPRARRVQPVATFKNSSPMRGSIKETNSPLSIRVNTSFMAHETEPREPNMIQLKGCVKEETVNTVIKEINEHSQQKVDMIPERAQVVLLKPRSTFQSATKLQSTRESFVKENQPRHIAPMRARKSNGEEEAQSAITLLPSSSFTGKLIERSRQKVVEKHASKILMRASSKNMIGRVQTLGEGDRTFENRDHLMNLYELTKNTLSKDPSMIRQYMNKHSNMKNTLHQQGPQEMSFEKKKI